MYTRYLAWINWSLTAVAKVSVSKRWNHKGVIIPVL